MPNGTAVALPLELLPSFAKATPGKPDTEILERIGEVVANAAIAVCAGVEEFQDGGLAPATQMQVGELFVTLIQLQQSTLGEIDFATVARREGKRAIMRRHGAMLSKHYSAAVLDAALDELVDRPLVVLRQVTAIERARMN
jgi:hypothetical protein